MLRIVPLGGLGEIGLNAMVFETEDEAFLVDCGIMFPQGEALGVDIVLPDFSYLRQLGDKLKGVVLTHGHEDHIGALPFLLQEMDLPIWGSGFTLGLLASKLEEAEILSPRLHELSAGGRAKVGRDFLVEGVRMTHSIPDALGLAIETPEGVLIHTGDFKLDPSPVGGMLTDLPRLGELGRQGVLALLSDSTNSERSGSTRSETLVGEALDALFSGAPGRVVVATFASNIHRIQQILDASRRHGRKVALFGRSVQQNVALALSMGVLEAPSHLFLDVERVQKRSPEEVTVLASGAQGEPRSALSRLAAGDPSMPFQLEERDKVILSSTAIPGNEVAIGNLLNDLAMRGVETVFGGEAHASGHASQEEQRAMIETVQPRHFVPVHGEYRHLLRHRRTAKETGVPEEACHLITDGQILEFDGGKARREGEVPVGRVYMDRQSGLDVSEVLLHERSLLAELGMVTAVVLVDRLTGSVIRGPELVARGVSTPDGGNFRDNVRREVLRALDALAPPLKTDRDTVQEEVRLAVRRVYRRATGRKPVVLPVVITL